MADIHFVRLNAGALHLKLAPALGGAMTRFWSDGHDAEGQTVDWLRPATEEGLATGNPLGMASFPLVPFCNRIRNGRAHFEGRDIRMPPNHPVEDSPHPLHGLGWQLPWEVADTDDSQATLTLEVAASEAWPWRFSAGQTFVLDDRHLQVQMRITNLDTAVMPAGIGHHPYFPHTPGTRLTSATAAMWRGDAEVMPTTLDVADEVRKLREGVVLSELHLDNNFTGWQHETLVDWPADKQGPKRSLLMEAQAPLDYFVLYCQRGYDYFCAEPVSQCTDWLNLMAQHGQAALGGARLAPGESLQASFSLTPRFV
jgi:aldose 1-epimerase